MFILLPKFVVCVRDVLLFDVMWSRTAHHVLLNECDHYVSYRVPDPQHMNES
jgi:hypothetical protein